MLAFVALEPNTLPDRVDNGRELPHGLVAPTRHERSPRPIGDVIVELEFASREVVDQAVTRSRNSGKPTGQILTESGELTQQQLMIALAERLGIHYVDLSVFELDMGAVALLSPELARRYRAVPIGFLSEQTLILAMADPTNIVTIDEVKMITDMKVCVAAAAEADIAALISRLNHAELSVPEVEEPEAEIIVSDLSEDGPAVKLVQSIVGQAIERRASDIHWNPGPTGMTVQFRIDGVPTEATTVTHKMAPSVVSRIKIMANLDISERRASQDGRLTLAIDGRRVDIRVVTLPLISGEGVVMRILDTEAVVRDLPALGMNDDARELFSEAVRRPYGTVLVSGPTGSGKSTTLYSGLDLINDGQRTILTIEDPVEAPLAGIKQMQVSPRIGLTFAAGLRAILRADPDVIMVGEIRDQETAQIAVQSALTGHLVLSTLHTRDAPSAIARLTDMGIEPFLVASAIDTVVAQRLVRTLCEQCKRPSDPPAAVRTEYGLGAGQVFEPAGCIRCGWTGYSGRTALYEVMPVTEEIRSLILNRGSADEIAAAAARSGMQNLRADAIDKVRQGVTSLVEAARVTATL
jgi:type IV pilus assembly protein PilB